MSNDYPSLSLVAVLHVINPRDGGREGIPQAPAEHAQVSVRHKGGVNIQVEIAGHWSS